MFTFATKIVQMRQQEDITLQSLAENEDIQIGYSDGDIVIVDSIQKFAEVKSAHVAMNSVVICTRGKVQGQMYGQQIELHQNQVAVIPQNVMITDVMVSPDFDLKAMFLTNAILYDFLREKINVWNEVMYVHRLNVVTMKDGDLTFYTHFYDMLRMAVAKGRANPFYTEVVQSLLRAAILALCGSMQQRLPADFHSADTDVATGHFQRFLNLLHASTVKYRTVEAYAGELCISPKYLSVICKKKSGKTANEWIREHVLEDIRYYLKQTDLSIKQICDRLNFSNASFFGKYVREHLGLTPNEYRKKFRQQYLSASDTASPDNL